MDLFGWILEHNDELGVLGVLLAITGGFLGITVNVMGHLTRQKADERERAEQERAEQRDRELKHREMLTTVEQRAAAIEQRATAEVARLMTQLEYWQRLVNGCSHDECPHRPRDGGGDE